MNVFMKILLVNNLYPPHTRGGAEQVVVSEAQGFRDAGHEVTVLTAEPFHGLRSLWDRATIEDGIRVLRFYPLNLFFYANDFKHGMVVRFIWHVWNLVNLHSAFVFARVLALEKPDAVHFHNLNGIGYLLPFVAKLSRVRTSLTLHGLQYAIPDGIMTVGHEYDFRVSGFFVRWYGSIVLVLLRPVGLIISPSQYLLDFYASRGFFTAQKKVVIHNPHGHFHALVHESETRGATRLLYVGQIEDHKGIFFLLDVIPSLSRDLVLTIIGVGSQTRKLANAINNKNNINYVGPVPHDQLAPHYSSADFLIFPSLYYENMPMVIAEAFAHGLPVIAARIGGVPELVRESETGFLFEPGNAQSLQDAIRRAEQSRAQWPFLRAQALAQAGEYSLPKYIRHLEAKMA